jgi:hypothetical protein
MLTILKLYDTHQHWVHASVGRFSNADPVLYPVLTIRAQLTLLNVGTELQTDLRFSLIENRL